MTISCQIPAFAPFGEAVRLARLADDLGFGSINCSHIAARDSFTLLAALAMKTTSVTLGTAVAPIYHRSPASMAQTAATVDDLSGGRFRLGLGVGHRSTMGGWHGQEIGRPVAEMREYAGVVRAVLAGEQPPPGERWNSTFAFTGFTPRPGIELVLAGLSPAMLRLAGEIADGVVLWACPASYVRDVVVPEVRAGRARAGKDLTGFTIATAVPVALGDGALDGVRSELHRYFGLPFYRTMFAAAGYAADLAAYDKATDVEAQKLAIGESFIHELCALGDAETVRESLRHHLDAGATEVILTAAWGTDFAPALEAAASTLNPED
ncbi:LLM class flavin-dependent oxidoreductase [Amycolatopsis sp. NPDC005232]|uniref:LLM class flavin-dependent oxidoreductase n=1 Tax=Amycolatopsis sp. NPDC005232 TaxID=3157027 RepID=UPI0033BDF62C